MAVMTELETRTYGLSGPTVIVLHGGPAAVGSAGPLARGLAGCCRVLEPWQRGSGLEPLTVAKHVADLNELVTGVLPSKPVLVGESWGAMLALAYAAVHPDAVRAVVLVGCGTFDEEARAQFVRTRDQRKTADMLRRLEQLQAECPDAAKRCMLEHDLTRRVYDYEPMQAHAGDESPKPFDMKAHTETWNDMLRLQKECVYPAAFAAITCPVLMLHGDYDPHPGPAIYSSLKRFIPQLEWREIEKCGHSPWNERWARDGFFNTLHEWIMERANDWHP